jgi:hypothetical protein
MQAILFTGPVRKPKKDSWFEHGQNDAECLELDLRSEPPRSKQAAHLVFTPVASGPTSWIAQYRAPGGRRTAFAGQAAPRSRRRTQTALVARSVRHQFANPMTAAMLTRL